jgi:hypothetical protein
MLTNKEKVLLKMAEELAVISDGNYDLRSGESYMTAESVHYAIRKWFSEEHIPEHIAGLMLNQDEPLERIYDFYVDSGYLMKAVQGNHFVTEYTNSLYHEHLRNILHDKVEKEYHQFLEDFKQKTPYDMPKLISEMTVKMQVYSVFRYDDQFNFNDKYLEQLIPIEDILDKVYKVSKVGNISTHDLAVVEKEVINSLIHLAIESKNEHMIEDDGYEMD